METRTAKRKAEAASLAQDQSSTKKRVVLGELPIPNLSNAILPVTLNQKCRKSTKVKKAVLVGSELDIDAKSDDLQKRQPYFSDIYSYLRKMEVILGCYVHLILSGGSG